MAFSSSSIGLRYSEPVLLKEAVVYTIATRMGVDRKQAETAAYATSATWDSLPTWPHLTLRIISEVMCVTWTISEVICMTWTISEVMCVTWTISEAMCVTWNIFEIMYVTWTISEVMCVTWTISEVICVTS